MVKNLLFAACAALLLFVACSDLTSCVSDGGSAPTATFKMASTPFYCEQLEDHFDVDAQALVTALGSMKFAFTSATDENGATMAKPEGMPDTIEFDGLQSCSFGFSNNDETVKNNCAQSTSFMFKVKNNNYVGSLVLFVSGEPSDKMIANDFVMAEWILGEGLSGGAEKLADDFSSIALFRVSGEKIVYTKE